MQDELLLIEQLKNQDTRALSALYDKYSAALYGVIFRICKDENQSEEVLQEAFMKIWDKSISYDSNKGKFFTWAYRIAKNLALNAIRKENKLIQNEDLSVYEDIGAKEPEKDFSNLNGSIKKLEEHHQKAIELVYFEGLTHREAHQKMGVPLGTFKSYIQQAIKKLRTTYQKEYFIFWLIIEMIR